MAKITKQQLSDELLEYINSNKGSNNNGNSDNTLPNYGNGNFEISDGSITEAKLDQNIKNKLNEVDTLKDTVRYKKDSIVESDLDTNLKEKLNIGGPKTWGALKNELMKTWGSLIGQ